MDPKCFPEGRHNANISTHQVFSNGEPCILFQARRLSLRYDKQKQLDLTERAFSLQKPVDTSQSVCGQDKATYVHLSVGMTRLSTCRSDVCKPLKTSENITNLD